MPILLKKNLFCKNDYIEKAINECESNEHVLYYNNHIELYNEYYKDLNNQNIVLYDLKCYNEIYNNLDALFVLFMDIDIKKEDYDLNIFENDKNNKKSNGLNNSNNIHESISDLIKNFIKFLIERNNKDIIIQEYKEKEIYMVDKKIKSEILKHVYITKNKNFKKYSFHIYFPKLIVNYSCISHIKNIVKSFKSVFKNPISDYIDDHVYKSNLSLRLLYCKKDKDDVFYHYPINCIYKNKNLEISDVEIELTKENFSNYLFTFNKFNEHYFIIKEYISEIEKNLDVITNIQPLNLKETSESNPYHYFLTMKKLFLMIFNLVNQTEFDFKCNLKNIKEFESNEKIADYNKKIYLEFDYKNFKCMFCNIKSHKNIHVIHIGKFGINIIKEGRSYNCKIKSIPFKNLDELEICKFIYSKNLIKRLSNDELIVFNNKEGWCLAKNKQNNFSALKKILLDNEHYFNEKDIKIIHKISETKLKENFNSLIEKNDIVDTYYPYLFKFANGIYDIKNEKFFNIEDSKDIYIINGVNYNFVDEKDYSEEQKKDKEYLQTVIDQIMPETIDGKINKNRLIFEINLSSCILMARKNVITIFQGETSAGKTTIKNLIVSTLGNNNYIELPISTYTSPLDPNKPNPWLGSIENKRVSFASESYYVDKLNSQTVKLLTEVKILSRNMYSSDVGQMNFLSQFIDTNHKLILDNPEAASYKRLAVIIFNSYFKNKENGNFFIATENSLVKNKFEEKNNLSEDILNKKYALIFFNILKNWARKYHLEKIVLKNTSEMSDFCILNNAILNTTILGYNFKIEYLKENKKNEYKNIKLQTSMSKELDTVVCTTNYFKKYFNNYITNKKLDINLNILLSKLKFERRNKTFVPLILFKDIKEDLLEEVVENYNKNKLIKNEHISLKYYKENIHDFTSFKESSDDEINDSDDEDKKEKKLDKIFELFD